MEYFKKYFSEVENWENEEVKVHCPYHSDTNPSASINTTKGLFHCFVCDIGYNEEQFIARINNISNVDANKLINKYEIKDNWETNKGYLWSDNYSLSKVKDLGLSEEIINELNLGIVKEEGSQRKYLGIPVYYNNILVDVRQYNLFKYDGQPKVRSNEGANVGWVIPYDKFLTSNNACYFFEGEKDMLMARDVGLNAYTLTGGAGAKPNDYVINAFKDKDIIICYDNDDAGVKGMNTFNKCIKDIAKSVKYINIGDVVKEVKEDFYDYITKYNGNVFEFYTLEQHHFILEETIEDYVTIKDALKENRLNKKIKSVVTVTSEFTDAYSVPSIVEATKIHDCNTKNDTMFEGEQRFWFLEDKTLKQMLELIEVNAKSTDVLAKIKMFLDISSKEPSVDIKLKDTKTVFKSIITDKDNDGSSVYLDIYSFEKLNVGMQYNLEYTIYSHPTKHQKLIAVATSVKLLHNNSNYVINKNKLSCFKSEGSIKDRINKLFESAKHHIAKHLNFDLWLMSDLVFNSILDFKYDEIIKGALDIFLLGDTRSGKALPLYEKVLTINGYKPMGAITKDDIVFCEDGTPVSINYVSYQGVRPVYRISFSDGTYVDCDKEHLWKVQSSKQRNCTGNYKIMTTNELMNIDYSRYSIDYVKPIEFPSKDVSIDPYTLGVLLGDGHLQRASSFCNSEEDIVDKIRSKYKVSEYKTPCHYGILGGVTTLLRNYGLIGTNARSKFIPNDYLINSKETRLELLKGLLDTDGYVCDNYIEFSTTSSKLAEGVKFLVESLGGRCTTSIHHNRFGEYYRLYIAFYNGIIPISSKKHLSKYKPITNRKKMIRDITYIGHFECQCINVNHKSHTFITNNMTITHNSECTSKLTELYNFGHFLSLKTSTTVGLVGGSNKVEGSYCNTIGAIPRQHKRLVVLEEFSGARPDFIRTMTDIRSSNELRIARVSGELVVPCKLRMITISNPINDESGNPRFLETFPNGVMPLMELIKSAEDVARYDGFLLIPKVENRFNPFSVSLTGEPIPKECYEEKANWVMTRGVDNVKFDDGIESYIWERAEELNNLFECNFPLFGTTTNKKLARFCVALASLVMSVDDSFENIIVTREIVDYIVDYLKRIYSSDVFKLNEYTKEYREYSEYSEEDVKILSDMYSNNSTIIDFISTQSRTTRSNLLSISGTDAGKFSLIFNRLVANKFVKLNLDNVYPTNKFRKVYNQIDKSVKTDIGNKIENSNGIELVGKL